MVGLDVVDSSTPSTPKADSLNPSQPMNSQSSGFTVSDSQVLSTQGAASAFLRPLRPHIPSMLVSSFSSVGFSIAAIHGNFSHWPSNILTVPSPVHSPFSTVASYASSFVDTMPQQVHGFDLMLQPYSSGLPLLSPNILMGWMSQHMSWLFSQISIITCHGALNSHPLSSCIRSVVRLMVRFLLLLQS